MRAGEQVERGEIVRIPSGTAIHRGGGDSQFYSRKERYVRVLNFEVDRWGLYVTCIFWLNGKGQLLWVRDVRRVEKLSDVELLAFQGRAAVKKRRRS